MALTQTQIETALAPIIKDGDIQLPSPAKGVSAGVTVTAFAALFAGAASMTAADLQAIDGGKLGYADAITAWQAAGYIT